jgi:hypothetical protein
MSIDSVILNPSQLGYKLEELIHNEMIRFPNVICYRENDIKDEFKDSSLNGIDHWIKKDNINILIQDKWKDSITQPEIAQFLTCAERLKSLIISSESLLPSFYLIWVSKIQPTSFGLKLLEEKNVITIINSKSIQSLSREVYWRIGDLLDDIFDNKQSNVSTTLIPEKRKKIIYDDTDEGISIYNELVTIQYEIHTYFQKIIMIINSCGGDLGISTINLFPDSLDKWKNFKKIDYNEFLRIAKKICVATKQKRVMSHFMEYYTKARALSVNLSQSVIKYTHLYHKLSINKSLKIKSFPLLKCTPEPMSQSEFTASIKNTNGYYQGMEFNFGTYYYNI